MEREALVTDGGRPLVADIITEADRLGRLVGDLFQLAATDASGHRHRPRPIDLAAIATDTVRQAEALAPSRRAHLAMAPRPGRAGRSSAVTGISSSSSCSSCSTTPSTTRRQGGTVTVGVGRVGGTVELTVADYGSRGSRCRIVSASSSRSPGCRACGGTAPAGPGSGWPSRGESSTAHRGTIRVDDAPGGRRRVRGDAPRRRRRVASRRTSNVTSRHSDETDPHLEHTKRHMPLPRWSKVRIAYRMRSRYRDSDASHHGLRHCAAVHRSQRPVVRLGLPGRLHQRRPDRRPQVLHRPGRLHRLRLVRDRLPELGDLPRRSGCPPNGPTSPGSMPPGIAIRTPPARWSASSSRRPDMAARRDAPGDRCQRRRPLPAPAGGRPARDGPRRTTRSSPGRRRPDADSIARFRIRPDQRLRPWSRANTSRSGSPSTGGSLQRPYSTASWARGPPRSSSS